MGRLLFGLLPREAQTCTDLGSVAGGSGGAVILNCSGSRNIFSCSTSGIPDIVGAFILTPLGLLELNKKRQEDKNVYTSISGSC